MESMEPLDNDSAIQSTAGSSRSLLNLSIRERQRKNKLACGVVAIICVAGITVGFGFLFIQRSEFVEEKFHYAGL